MSLASLKNRVREILAVGTSLDSLLDDFIQDALEDFEGGIILPYMRRTQSKELTSADRTITLVGKVKRISWARRLEETDEGLRYHPIGLVQDWQAALTGTGTPGFVWLLDENTMEFDLGPILPATVQVQYWAESDWPLADDSAPLTKYRRFLLARTIYEARHAARKIELGESYNAQYMQMMARLQIEADAQLHDWAEVYMGGSL